LYAEFQWTGFFAKNGWLMHLPANSVLWGITLSLFAGGLGIPLPENALLIAGGYAIYQEICPVVVGMPLWYAALICGDITLFLLVRWLFSRPVLSHFLDRLVRPAQLGK
jgi:membrane protein DedA with SNARE-associated domain